MSLRRCLTLACAMLLAGCQAPLGRLSTAPVLERPWRAPVRALSPASAPTPQAVPDQLLVGLAPGARPEALMARPELGGYRLKRTLRLGDRRLLKLGLPSGVTPEAARAAIAPLPDVDRVSEDWIARPTNVTPDDTRYAEQWAHAHAATGGAWAAVSGVDQSRVVLAVLDTGMDVTHPEFAGRVVGAQNFTTGGAPDANVTDADGHGTHVAGIAAAAGNNARGVAGVAWGVKVMPLKVLGGSGGTFDVLDGLMYAVRYAPGDGTRVRVINMSLGIPSAAVSGFFAQAIAEAREAGILVVAAAGNDGRDGPHSPSTAPHCVAVGATTRYLGWEMLAGFSNYGDRLDLTAPGAEILSTLPTAGSPMGQEYGFADGTSMAAPYVAGVAALMVAKYDGTHARADAAFADQLRTRLLASVDDLGAPGRDPVFGEGRLNATKALTPATLP